MGVERTFQTYSPLVDSITVKRRGDVRQAKLYYLRELSGRAARIKEKLSTLSTALRNIRKAACRAAFLCLPVVSVITCNVSRCR